MKNTTLVILAAGMGSRYGGLKQLDPVGPGGEFIIDYSIYDAKKAGFNKIVFIIKKENYELFHETVGKRIAEHIDVAYAFQDMDKYTEGISIPKERQKPLGTAHALLCAKDCTKDNFAVINADDYYGSKTFRQLHDFLARKAEDDYKYCMIGFQITKTLTENGTVSRGVCEVADNGELLGVTEMTKLKVDEDGIIRNHEKPVVEVAESASVSMNCWGFTTDIFDSIQEKMKSFFEENKDNILKAEFYLPSVVAEDIKEEKCHVKVLKTSERWFGVTYKEDKVGVVQAIRSKIENGIYPEHLWK